MIGYIVADLYYWHFPSVREAARQLSDNASGMRLSGDPQGPKQALEGMRDLVFLGRVMRLQSKGLLGSIIGQAVASIAFYGGGYSPALPKTTPRPRPGSAAYARDPRSLLLFAQSQKRPDIATSLATEWKACGIWRAKTTPWAAKTFLVGFNPRDFWWALAGERFGALLLMSVPPLLVWALVTSVLLRVVPAWRREPDALLGRVSWVAGGALTFIATAMLSSALLWAFAVVAKTPRSSLGDWFFALVGETSNGARAPLVWQAYFPVLLGALLALYGAATWNKRRLGHPSLGARLRHIFHPPDDQIARFDLSPLLALTAALGAFFAGTVGVLAYLIVPSPHSEFASLHNYAAPALAGFAVVLALPALANLRSVKGLGFAVQLARRFAWAQLLVVTLGWGLIQLFTAPANARFSAQFTRQLQVGEFQLARKKLGI